VEDEEGDWRERERGIGDRFAVCAIGYEIWPFVGVMPMHL
jgi:hypothetical protein